MDGRILIGAVFGLILMAFGGFYVALGPHGHDEKPVVAPPLLPPPPVLAPAPAAAPGAAPIAASPVQAAPPPMATPDSIEAEFAVSEHAPLLAVLKQSFPDDYKALVDAAARRRNEGASDQAFGQDVAERFQDIMRGKLKFGAQASMPTIDRLAANEASLFHALGTEGAPFCLKMLGRDDSPATGPPPNSVRQLMALGTLYRFQAIAEGMSNSKPVEPLTKDETKAYEASLSREGLNLRDVNSGTFLKTANEPGKPCLTLEALHRAVARLQDSVRRKVYSSMFFANR